MVLASVGTPGNVSRYFWRSQPSGLGGCSWQLVGEALGVLRVRGPGPSQEKRTPSTPSPRSGGLAWFSFLPVVSNVILSNLKGKPLVKPEACGLLQNLLINVMTHTLRTSAPGVPGWGRCEITYFAETLVVPVGSWPCGLTPAPVISSRVSFTRHRNHAVPPWLPPQGSTRLLPSIDWPLPLPPPPRPENPRTRSGVGGAPTTAERLAVLVPGHREDQSWCPVSTPALRPWSLISLTARNGIFLSLLG